MNGKYVSSLINPHQILVGNKVDSDLSQRSRISLSLLRRNSKHSTRKTPSARKMKISDRTFERCTNCWAPRALFRGTKEFNKHKSDCFLSYCPTKRCDRSTECVDDCVFHYKSYFHIDTENFEIGKKSSRCKPNRSLPVINYFRYYPKKKSTRSIFSDNFDSDFEDKKSFLRKTALTKSRNNADVKNNNHVIRQPVVVLRKLSEKELTASMGGDRGNVNAAASRDFISPTKTVRTSPRKEKQISKNNNTIDRYFKPKILTEGSNKSMFRYSDVPTDTRNERIKLKVSQIIIDSLKKSLPSRKSSYQEEQSTLSSLVEHSEISVSETALSTDESDFDIIFRNELHDDGDVYPISPKKRKIYDDIADVKDNTRPRRLSSDDSDCDSARLHDTTAVMPGESNEQLPKRFDDDVTILLESKETVPDENHSSFERSQSKKQRDLSSHSIENMCEVEECLKLSAHLDFPNNLGLVKQENTTTSCSTYFRHSVDKRCPNTKLIAGTRFAVDAFKYGVVADVTHYFLTHFHKDHYKGLDRNFRFPVVCSPITARLVQLFLYISDEYLKIIEINESTVIDGVTVTAYDANHCPGAVMFLFSLPNKKNILHVGGFRATFEMESLPCFWNLNIDRLYLDTTYCNPEYDFPSQQEAITLAVNIVNTHRQLNPKLLVVVGTCTVGKEKFWLRIATTFDWHVWASSSRIRRALECLDNAEISKRIRTEPTNANLHLLPMSQIHEKFLHHYLSNFGEKFTHVLGLQLCGKLRWIETKPDKHQRVTVRGIQYSEHSNYNELERFVKFVRPKQIIPLVEPKLSSSTVALIIKAWCKQDDS